MTTSTTLHQQKQAPGLGGDLQRQAQAANGLQRSRLLSLGRPVPGACHQRSLLSAIDELTDAVRLLTSALVGEAPMGLPDPLDEEGLSTSDGFLGCTLPLQQEPSAQAPSTSLAAALTPEQEAQIVADATELWDTPWEALSVVELRALLRDLPIDRSALPAPIEYLRRHELLDALLHLPATTW